MLRRLQPSCPCEILKTSFLPLDYEQNIIMSQNKEAELNFKDKKKLIKLKMELGIKKDRRFLILERW